MANIVGVYEIGVTSGTNRVNLGCITTLDEQTITTWNGVAIESGSTLTKFAADHLTTISIHEWFIDKWAVLVTF